MLTYMCMVNKNIKSQKLFSTQEVANLLGISRVAVFKKIKNGEIEAEKIGRNYVIPAESLGVIFDKELSDTAKTSISSSVDKVIDEYGETIKLLGNE